MNYIAKNKQSFGTVAKDYKKYRGTYNDKLFKLITSFLDIRKKELVVLDLGCGVGNSTEPFTKQVEKLKNNVLIFGCDPDIEMLKEAKKSARKQKLPITYVEGGAEKIPFKKDTLDLVFSGAAFHWFATKKALKEIKRVLKTDGLYVVFWTKNRPSKKPVIGGELYKKYGFKGIPQKWRDETNVERLFKQSGLKKITVTTIPYTEKRTIAEAIGLMKTNSGYAILSPEQQKTIVKEMTAAYKKALGSKLDVSQQDIYVCYGFK